MHTYSSCAQINERLNKVKISSGMGELGCTKEFHLLCLSFGLCEAVVALRNPTCII